MRGGAGCAQECAATNSLATPFQIQVKPKAPAYSLPARVFAPQGGSIAPGPGAYQADRPDPRTQRAPAYSMGLRTPTPGERPSVAPGPGAYAPKAGKGAPAYSMAFRHSKDDPAAARSPGPGEYQPMSALRLSLKSAPAYTLRSRTPLPLGHSGSPGPGQYRVDLRPGTPSYSIAQKLKVPSRPRFFVAAAIHGARTFAYRA